jgi:outer membrane protein W
MGGIWSNTRSIQSNARQPKSFHQGKTAQSKASGVKQMALTDSLGNIVTMGVAYKMTDNLLSKTMRPKRRKKKKRR